jgi:hypothetical protein
VKKVYLFIKKEFLEMLPPTIFFTAVLFVIVFTRNLMSLESAAGTLTYAAALIGALVVGKSVLIADALPIWDYFNDKPRIELIVGRTIAYALVALLFQVLEEFIPLALRENSMGAALSKFVEEVQWARFWGTHILLLVFLALYNILAVIVEEMGRDRFRQMLFSESRATR